jgi:hypothetical protein
MKSDKAMYINLMIPLAVALFCYLISLVNTYHKMESKPIVYMYYPFLNTLATLALYLVSKWFLKKYNWVVTAMGILITVSIFFKLHWSVV